MLNNFHFNSTDSVRN